MVAERAFFKTFAVRGCYQNLIQQDSKLGLTRVAGLQYAAGGFTVNFNYGWVGDGRLQKTRPLTLAILF